MSSAQSKCPQCQKALVLDLSGKLFCVSCRRSYRLRPKEGYFPPQGVKTQAPTTLPAPPPPVSVVATPIVVVTPAVETKTCPFCGEVILIAARKCKHCRETLDPVLRAAEESQRAAEESRRADKGVQSTVVVNTQVKSGQGYRPSFASWHLFHLILTLFTLGLWLPFWITHWVLWLLLH